MSVRSGGNLINSEASLPAEESCTVKRARAERRHTLGVLAVAFVLRTLTVWYCLAHFPSTWLFSRGQEMGLVADSLSHGRGFGSPFGVPTGPTALIAPGYPLFIAGVFRIFGSFTRAAATSIMFSQIVINLITISLILKVGRSIVQERAAVIVSSFWACSVPLIWMPTILWDTSLSTCLLLGAVALFLRLRGNVRTIACLAIGGYCGFAGLVNPALLPALLLMALWTISRERRLSSHKPALVLLAFVVVFSPWPIRNARVFHAWIPTRTTVGLELWMGNHPGSTGFLEERVFPTFNQGELHRYEASGEVAYTRSKESEAFVYIRAHEAIFLRLCFTRVGRFWMGTGTQHGSPVFVLHGVLTTLFGLVGAVFLLKSKQRAIAPLLLFPLLVFPIPYYLTHAEFRYRLVLDPILAVLAAKTIDHILLHLESKRQQSR